jgi:hypothetical protein
MRWRRAITIPQGPGPIKPLAARLNPGLTTTQPGNVDRLAF